MKRLPPPWQRRVSEAPRFVPGAATGLEWRRHRDDFVGTVDGSSRFLLTPTVDDDWILYAADPKTGIQTRKLGRYGTAADAKDAARQMLDSGTPFGAPTHRIREARGGDETKRLVMAIYNRMPIGNKGFAPRQWSPEGRLDPHQKRKHQIMFSGPSAKAFGVENYTTVTLEDLSLEDLRRAAKAVGVVGF